MALFGPLVAPYDYAAQDATQRLQGPSLGHLMGTDNFGRDVFSRVLVGARDVFYLGGVGTLLAAVIGTSLGLLAGYVGRLWDEAIMRVLDVLLAFPALLLAMVLLATVGPSDLNLILVITVLYIPMFARIARSMVLDLRTREFVEAARLRGEKRQLHPLPGDAAQRAASAVGGGRPSGSPTPYSLWPLLASWGWACRRPTPIGAGR